MWLAGHDLHDLPDSLAGFGDFYEARRLRLLARLGDLLGIVDPGTVRSDRCGFAEPGSGAGPAGSSAPQGSSSVRVLPGPGVPPEGVLETPEATTTRKARQHRRVTIPDLISQGQLHVGQKLHARYLGRLLEVEVTPDGNLTAHGQVFSSPSRAASAIGGMDAVNGWAFWRTESGETIGSLR